MMSQIEKAVLFDLDHTISDASVRDHLIPEARRTDQWEDYHLLLVNDKPCHDIVEVINVFRHCGYPVIGITARPSRYRSITWQWLSFNKIALDELLMHKRDFWEPSAELKLALVKERFGEDFAKKVLMIIDDHPEVIAAFQKAGVTALQCFGRKYVQA